MARASVNVILMDKIPVTVLVVTRNEESRLPRCLAALGAFDQIIVADSHSADHTASVAQSMGAEVFTFSWNEEYPKKRQWCLDHLPIRHDFVFMVDADEVVTPELTHEISDLFANGTPEMAGYFVRGRYVRGGDVLCYGLQNNKLALLNRHKMTYPVVDDLDIDGMGEIEGHYQPVPHNGDAVIGQLSNHLIHDAYGAQNDAAWVERHKRYAHWEAAMDARNAWPVDPVSGRQSMKSCFKGMPPWFRPLAAFIHCYVLRLGVLDGVQGFLFARDRYRYYSMIADEKRLLAVDGTDKTGR